jgi:hypothetical protein
MPVGIKEKEYAEGSNSRKAEPSIEKKGDDGVNKMNDIIAKQRFQDDADTAVIKEYVPTKTARNFTMKSADKSLRSYKRRKNANVPVGV